MADLFAGKDANGNTVNIYSDEVTGPAGGPAQKQLVGIVDGSLNGTNALIVDANGRISVNIPIGGGYTLQQGVINVSASGDATLVAAQGSGKVIYLVSYAFVVAAAVTVQFKSASTVRSGAMPFAANGGIERNGTPGSPMLWTNANEALIISLGSAVQVSGHYTYCVV
jgi:hypothetical protein